MSDWSALLDVLTPVELHDGRWFKREDLFAPMGAGCPDGTKVRNLIWLFGRYAAAGGTGVLAGGSVHSPAIARVAVVAKHYGLRCTVVLGATKPDTAMKHPNIAIAAMAGAEFHFVKVAYNPAIQKAIGEIATAHPDWLRVAYGISLPDDAPDVDVAEFHALGAQQVANVPAQVETMIVPAGSCNATASVLMGIAATPPKSLRHVDLIGMGPSRLDWLRERVAAIERGSGANIMDKFGEAGTEYTLRFHDLHGEKFATYADRRPYTLSGIRFHPTYEGKAQHYMIAHPDRFRSYLDGDSRSLFWIVGGESSVAASAVALCG